MLPAYVGLELIGVGGEVRKWARLPSAMKFRTLVSYTTAQRYHGDRAKGYIKPASAGRLYR